MWRPPGHNHSGRRRATGWVGSGGSWGAMMLRLRLPRDPAAARARAFRVRHEPAATATLLIFKAGRRRGRGTCHTKSCYIQSMIHSYYTLCSRGRLRRPRSVARQDRRRHVAATRSAAAGDSEWCGGHSRCAAQHECRHIWPAVSYGPLSHMARCLCHMLSAAVAVSVSRDSHGCLCRWL